MKHKQLIEICPQPNIVVPILECNGTITDQSVKEVNGVYVLNQHKYHTERVYDNVTATAGGTITIVNTASNITFNLAGIIDTNWIGGSYLTDFGNGYVDKSGLTPSFNYSNEPNGRYEIKVFKEFVYPEGTRYYLIATWEIDVLNGVVTIVSAATQTINRSITYTTKEVFQNYCDSTPVGNPYVANGTVATLVGTLSQTYREELSEWLGVTDANNPSGASITPTVITPTYSTNRTLQTINTTPAAYNVAVPANTREITIQNITGADIQISTSQGVQIVGSRNNYTMSNPNNTTINHNIFTGNVNIAFLSNVLGNINGVAPRVILTFKSY